MLRELAELRQFRVAVATRPLTAAPKNRFTPGGLLPTLGVTGIRSSNLVDLDDDRYFEVGGLEAFADAVLAQDEATNPGPPGGAWSWYSRHPAVRARLARVVAARAGRNYLVAAIAADMLSTADVTVDPDLPGFSSAVIPRELGDALENALSTWPDPELARGLLTALAYARGEGIDDQTWLGFATALGYPIGVADLDRLRGSRTADYLLQDVATDSVPLTRLFHQALADQLVAVRLSQRDDERKLLRTLLPPVGTGWTSASDYARAHASEHATISGDLPQLLDDFAFVTIADFTRLVPLLPTSSRNSGVGEVIVRADARARQLSPDRRRRLLALTAAHLGLTVIQNRFNELSADPVRPHWAHTLGGAHQQLRGHRSPNSFVLGRFGGQDVIVSGSADDTIRIWNAATGEPIGAPVVCKEAVFTVALGVIGNQDVIVSGGSDGIIGLRNAATGESMLEPIKADTWSVHSVALGRAGDQEIIVSGGANGGVQIWNAVTGQLIAAPRADHGEGAASVVLGRIGEHDVIVACFERDDTILILDAATGELFGSPIVADPRGWRTMAVTLGRCGQRDLIAAGGEDGTIRIWDAGSRIPIGEPLSGHDSSVRAVVLGKISGREVIAGASYDGTILIWDVSTNELLCTPLSSRVNNLDSLALGHIGERDVVVSNGNAVVRIWYITLDGEHPRQNIGHPKGVADIALGRVGHQNVIVSSGWDNTIRIWDAASGVAIGGPLAGHSEAVVAVDIGRVGGQEVVASASYDNTIRLWDAAQGVALSTPIPGHFTKRSSNPDPTWRTLDELADSVQPIVALARIRDKDIIASVAADNGIRILEAETGDVVLNIKIEHPASIWRLVTGRVGQRDVLVSIGDKCLWVWDAATGEPFAPPIIDYSEDLTSVVLGRVTSRDVIVTGGLDHAIRIWDGSSGAQVGLPLLGHSDWITSLAMGQLGGRDVIVSGSVDATLRIWDIGRGTSIVVDTLERVDRVGAFWGEHSALVCVVSDGSLCAFVVDDRFVHA